MRPYILWHPDSPGVRLYVPQPSLLRRLGIIRSPFATLGEATKRSTDYIAWFHPDQRIFHSKDLTGAVVGG